MRSSLFSPSWYRVASLKPRLRSHAEIHRHEYRGELWYVLQDHSSGRLQRFTPAAYLVIGLMDGQRTVQNLWEIGKSHLGNDAPTQDEVIRLLSQLHAADVLLCDVPPDTLELLNRSEKKHPGKWKQNVRNPLAIRFKLFDPERFLLHFQFLVKPLFSWLGAIGWSVIVGYALFLVCIHWPELSENVTDRVFAPGNLVMVWLIFPILKLLHEFGHAFTVKLFGGEVHEMGIIFLVFTPIPYVDASASSAIRNKWQRILVGAAGIAVELFIAALAIFVWINIEPGLLRAAAYNVILIAGISSIIFNINPLLRYDGYYILMDLLEIPNLGPRGVRYTGYLLQRYLFGIGNVEPPASTPGEHAWFVSYTVAAFIYRIFIYAAIIIFIADKFYLGGVLLAIWALVSMVALPMAKGTKFLLSSSKLGRKRTRAIVATLLITASIIAIVCLLPVPLSTKTEGVMWVEDNSFVRARTEGFIDKFVTEPGERIRPGDMLVQCSDPLLPANIRVLESQHKELDVIYKSQVMTDRVKAQITREELNHLESRLKDAREREEELKIYSKATGTFHVPTPQDSLGRFVRRGDLLGYVIEPSIITVRVAVSQPEADLVRERTRGVRIRLPQKIDDIMPATLKREVPAATNQLPARALGQAGGGTIAIDPRDEKGIKAFQKLFLFDIELPANSTLLNVGGRVYVRFDHGSEPVIWRWYRVIREVFLNKFNK